MLESTQWTPLQLYANSSTGIVRGSPKELRDRADRHERDRKRYHSQFGGEDPKFGPAIRVRRYNDLLDVPSADMLDHRRGQPLSKDSADVGMRQSKVRRNIETCSSECLVPHLIVFAFKIGNQNDLAPREAPLGVTDRQQCPEQQSVSEQQDQPQSREQHIGTTGKRRADLKRKHNPG